MSPGRDILALRAAVPVATYRTVRPVAPPFGSREHEMTEQGLLGIRNVPGGGVMVEPIRPGEEYRGRAREVGYDRALIEKKRRMQAFARACAVSDPESVPLPTRGIYSNQANTDVWREGFDEAATQYAIEVSPEPEAAPPAEETGEGHKHEPRLRRLFVIDDAKCERFRVTRQMKPDELPRWKMNPEPFILVEVSKAEAGSEPGVGSNRMSVVFSRSESGEWTRGFDPDAESWYVKTNPKEALDGMKTLL